VNERWRKSWLYRWLQAHKAEYGVERIEAEAWHWEFRSAESRNTSEGGPSGHPTGRRQQLG
jgi:hypothetical protein